MHIWIPLPLIVAAGLQSPESARLLREADAALEARDAARALALAEQVLRADPRSAQAFAVRGQARRLQREFQAAVADYTRAIELDPKGHRAYGGRALARLGLEAHEEALRDIDQALALEPGYARGWIIKGDILIDRKRHREALEGYERAVRLDPKSAAAMHGRARCKANLGDPAGAVADYDAALALEPSLIHAVYNRALSLEALREHRRAAADYGACIEKGHRAAEAHFRRGLAQQALGDLPAAKRDWTRALELDPMLTAARQRLSDAGGAASGGSRSGGTPAADGLPGFALKLPSLKSPSGALWVKPSEATVPLTAAGPALSLPADDPGAATRALPLAELSYAMEALKSVAGPLSPEQERAWGKKWQPYFDFPDPEALAYFQKLNPVLSELQTVRAAAHQAAQDFDAAWGEAVLSHAVGDAEEAAGALAQAERHAQSLQSVNGRLAEIQKRAQALGNPPDPQAAKARARAWSRKWSGGPSELARQAYRWRASQLSARNADGHLKASMARTTYEDVWPADEETWCRWLDAGKQGPEPRGPRPSREFLEEATRLLESLVDKTGIGPCLRIHWVQNVPPEVAVRIAREKGRVRPWVLPGFVHREDCALCKGASSAAAPPPPSQLDGVAGPDPKGASETEADRKAKLEAIAEKEDLIKLIQRNLARDEADFKRERDPLRREQLYLRILNNQSAIQQERDLIASLRTGEVVHTRTPSDAYCHDLMIVRTVEHMQAVEETRRLAAAVEKMAAKAEYDQVPQLQAFIGRQITHKDIAEGNYGKVRQAAQAVFDTVQGRREQRAAEQLEKSVEYADYELRAQRVKTSASFALLFSGIAATGYAAGAAATGGTVGYSTTTVTGINVVYGATTGTIEGGPVEGIKQAVAMTGLPGMVAAETMTGYQRGGLLSSGGVIGALERGTEAFLIGKAVEGVASRVGAWWAARGKAAAVPPPVARPGLTVKEFVEGQSFQLAKNNAMARIRQYRETAAKIKAARAAGADPADLAALEAQRLKQAAALNEDFLAKRILKAEGKAARAGRGPAAGAELERDVAQAVETINRTQVDPAFRKAVKDAGYHWRKVGPGGLQKAGDLKFKDMRHGDAGKTINTDRDLGLEEPADGAYRLFKGDQPVKLEDAERELQQLYNQSYRNATGGDPARAMQNITTSRSAEAYKDLGYTHLTDPANVGRVKKGWAGQAAEVLKNKVAHAGAGQGDLATLIKKIDGANQAAKDIQQRLLPVLRSNQAKATGKKAFEIGQDMDRFHAIQRALEEVERDPVGASRKLKVLTGLDSIGEVSDLVSRRFLGGVKLQ